MAKTEDIKRGYTGYGFSAVGFLLGAIFFTLSLTPSLMPRDPVMQGVLAGVVGAIGYQIAIIGLWCWRFLDLPEPPNERARTIARAAIILGVLILIYGLWRSNHWQNVTRLLMGLEPVESAHRVTIAGIGLVVFLLLVALFKLFVIAAGLIKDLARRLLPDKIALALGVVVTLWVFVTILNGFLLQKVLDVADASFAARDAFIDPEMPPPADPMITGSEASLVHWDDLGRRGREYMTTGPTVPEIAEFYGDTAMAPIRVYVGRNSASTSQERADLALQELIRVGGFDREFLLVMVPVGTGWMDPGAQDSVEFITGGDIATVAAQYSYLTSVLSLWVHPQDGIDQARDLFYTVYGYWTKLPPETRPRLIVHGLSQGAFVSEMSLPLLDLLGDPIDGAFWAGSPFMSPFWAHIRDNPNPGSIPWRPQRGNGSLMRVMDQHGGLDEATADWGPIRLVFLQYPSDAIVHFTFDSAFRRPDWMGEDRAPDVSPELHWFPVVTMFQVALDMMLSLQVPRFGHFYVYQDYIDGWAALIAPPGWTPERSAELKLIFDERPPAF
jgi:uncharacterized membrane protein